MLERLLVQVGMSMSRRLWAIVLLCGVSPFALAQNGAATQSKGLVKRPAEIPENQADSAQKMVRMTLDVVVTDHAGNPVTGLSEADFKLLDNGTPAKIVSFKAAAADATDADPVQVILLVDTVNNSFESVATERDQIVKYLSQNNGQLPVPISIALLADSGVKLDQPSRDGNVLIAELKKTTTAIRTLNSAMAAEGALERFQRSLKALTQMLSYEQTKPGRKLLIWIGPGWPMLAGIHFGSTNKDNHANFDSIVSFSTSLRESRTTLYSVDTLTSESNLAHDVFYQNFLRPVTSVKAADSGSLATPVLALQSGGLVLKGSNDLVGEIARCVADARAAYTLTFEVPAAEAVNDYHGLEVKLAKAGLTARTNTGYYAQPYTEPRQSEAAAIGQAGTGPASTLRTDVRLVVLDVTVSDGKGAPVTGRKTGDFQLKEDGTTQKIASVEEHTGTLAGSAVQAPAAVAGPDGTISASNKPVSSPGSWNVLLFDQFNTTREDQAAALRQLKLFVKQLPPEEPVALVAMTGQIKILSSFGDGAGGISRLLDKNGLPPSGNLEPANLAGSGPAWSSPDVQGRTDVERQAQHAQKTLDCFSALAKWLSSYPGRKNVYWLTGGFPLQGQPFGVAGYTQLTPTGPANHDGQAIPMGEKTDKELEAARVAIYPIDARGVAPPEIVGETSADTQGNLLSIGKLGDKSIDVRKDDQLKAAQATEMQAIASATGGVASFNNDIAKALQDDFKRGGSYYTISYTPSDTAWNGTYRKINLTLEQRGYQLTYRQGYYAEDLQAPAPTSDEFRMALRRGSPPESAVLFSAKVGKAADSVNVEYAIESKTLHYQPDASGKLVANAECAVVAYDSNGKIVGTSLIQFSSSVSPEQRAALANGTIHAKQTVALKGGAASLVLGVRDQTTGSFGDLAVSLSGN